MRPLPLVLAPLFAALWAWSLATANPLGGFIHVPLVAAVVCASFGLLPWSAHHRAEPERGRERPPLQTHLPTT